LRDACPVWRDKTRFSRTAAERGVLYICGDKWARLDCFLEAGLLVVSLSF
jgi:hypothetical protein